MVDKLSAQQINQLNNYLKANPKVKREDAIKLLFNYGASGKPRAGSSFENKSGSTPTVRYLIVKTKDGKSYNFNKTLEKRINNISAKIAKAESENGFIGSAWSGFKNLTGIGDSSDKVREQQAQEKKLLTQFNSQPNNRAKLFEQLTGQKYTTENLEKFIKGQIKLKSEIALQGYKEGQEMAVDVGADIVSGIAAVGIYSAAVAAAPFTGGASIAVGVVAAGASGAAIKTGLKAADAATGGRKYTLKDAGHDAATGAFSGIIAPITGGMGGAVGKTVATKLGIQAVKTVGKEVAEEVVETGVKQGLNQGIKTALTNPTGYEYVGGNIAKRAAAMAAEMASDGAVGGAIDNSFRTALDGGGVNEVLQAGVEGFVGGLILSPVVGGGFKAVGKAGHEIGSKIKGGSEAAADAVETSVVKNTAEVVPTPKPQGANTNAELNTSATTVGERTIIENTDNISKELTILEKSEKLKQEILTHHTFREGEKVPRFTPEQAENIIKLYQNDEKFMDELLYKDNSFMPGMFEYEYDELVKIAQFHKSNKELTEFIINNEHNYYVTRILESAVKHLDKYSEKEVIKIIEHFEKLSDRAGMTTDFIRAWLDDPIYFTLLSHKIKDNWGNTNYLISDVRNIYEKETKNLKRAMENGQIEKLAKELGFDGHSCTIENINDDGTFQMCVHNGDLCDNIEEINYQIRYSIKRVDFKIDEKGNIHKVASTTGVGGSEGYTTKLSDGSKIIDFEDPTGKEIRKEFYGSNGELIRTDVIQASEKLKGTFEITTSKTNPDGTITTDKIGSVKLYGSKEQGSRARTRVISPSGIISDQIRIEGPKGRGSTYKIIDKNNKVLFKNRRTSRMITSNHYRSFHNGTNYDIKFEGDKITVGKIGNNSELEDVITLDSNLLDPKLIDLYKQLPGDYFYKLHKYGIKVELGGDAKPGNACFISQDGNKICMSEELKNNPFTFAHELGHALDLLEFNQLCEDKTFKSLYKAEMEKFKLSSAMAERHSIDYFTTLDNEYNHFKEFIAETHALISGLRDDDNHLGIRSAVLQQNFPRTIAYLAKKLEG